MSSSRAPLQPLRGVRVADFSSNMAGPMGAMILAQLGADVVKVEPPQGDDAREWAPSVKGVSATHLHMGAGKRSIVVDLKKSAGVDVALALIARSDVVLLSMRPGVADRLGIGQKAVLERNPGILYYELNAFGDGPLGSSMPGYDPLVQAFSGIMQMTGHDGSPTTRCAPSIIDIGSGLWIAMGVLAALMARQNGEAIASVQTALVDTAFSLVPHQAMSARVTGARPAKAGSGNTIAAPYQCFTTRDGEILIAAPSDRLWRTLVAVLGAPELADDPRFLVNADRLVNLRELEAKLNAILRQRDSSEWLERLAAAGVPATRVSGLDEAVVSEIAMERRTFAESGGVPLVRLPWLVDGQPLAAKRPAPELGEHTIEILEELGFDGDDVSKLLACGAVRAFAEAEVSSMCN